MDFAGILKSLPAVTVRQPNEVSRDELIAKARAMARRGYVHSEETLAALEAYLQGYGVLLSGGLGIGKSLFFETVNPEPIKVLSFNRCHLWTADQLGDWLDQNVGNEIVCDDIGWDAEKARNYGQRFETLQYVLDARLTMSGCRTHFTTNLTNEELIGKYDAHLVDRIYQLCKCFALPPQESRREATVFWSYIRNRSYERKMGKEEL